MLFICTRIRSHLTSVIRTRVPPVFDENHCLSSALFLVSCHDFNPSSSNFSAAWFTESNRLPFEKFRPVSYAFHPMKSFEIDSNGDHTSQKVNLLPVLEAQGIQTFLLCAATEKPLHPTWSSHPSSPAPLHLFLPRNSYVELSEAQSEFSKESKASISFSDLVTLCDFNGTAIQRVQLLLTSRVLPISQVPQDPAPFITQPYEIASLRYLSPPVLPANLGLNPGAQTDVPSPSLVSDPGHAFLNPNLSHEAMNTNSTEAGRRGSSLNPDHHVRVEGWLLPVQVEQVLAPTTSDAESQPAQLALTNHLDKLLSLAPGAALIVQSTAVGPASDLIPLLTTRAVGSKELKDLAPLSSRPWQVQIRGDQNRGGLEGPWSVVVTIIPGPPGAHSATDEHSGAGAWDAAWQDFHGEERSSLVHSTVMKLNAIHTAQSQLYCLPEALDTGESVESCVKQGQEAAGQLLHQEGLGFPGVGNRLSEQLTTLSEPPHQVSCQSFQPLHVGLLPDSVNASAPPVCGKSPDANTPDGELNVISSNDSNDVLITDGFSWQIISRPETNDSMSEVSMSVVEDAIDRDDILITDGFSWKIVSFINSNSRMSDVSPRDVEDSTVNDDVLITDGFSWQIVSNQQPAVPSSNINYHTQHIAAAAQEERCSSTHAAGILGSDSGKVAARSTSALDSTDREQQAVQQEPGPPEIECSRAGADGRTGAGANDSNNSSHSHHGSDYSGQGGTSGAFLHVLVLGLFSLAMYSASSTFKRKQPETSKEGDTAMVGGDTRSGGDQPGSGGDQPRSGGDQPRSGGDQPGSGGDQPGSGGDQPRSGGDSGDQPRSGGDQPRPGGDQPGKIIIGTANSDSLSNTRALLTRGALLLQSVSRGPPDATESDQKSPSAGGAVWDERSALVFLKQLEANMQLELETLMALLPDSEATTHRAQALKSELISVRMQINALKQELDSKYKL